MDRSLTTHGCSLNMMPVVIHPFSTTPSEDITMGIFRVQQKRMRKMQARAVAGGLEGDGWIGATCCCPSSRRCCKSSKSTLLSSVLLFMTMKMVISSLMQQMVSSFSTSGNNIGMRHYLPLGIVSCQQRRRPDKDPLLLCDLPTTEPVGHPQTVRHRLQYEAT